MFSLFPGIVVFEGLIPDIRRTGDKLYAMHGNQGQLLNDKLRRINGFLVRYIWKPLENVGVLDPTAPGRIYEGRVKNICEILKRVEMNKQGIMTGHTHLPSFPDKGGPLYLNAGSSIQLEVIT